MSRLSIVIPCYNEAPALPLFWEEIQAVADQMSERNDLSFEFYFVNDGSRDETLGLLREISAKDKRAHYLSLSRNFGKEAALCAGLRYAQGDYVAVMDADLQDPPSLLPQMYEALLNGVYDCAATRIERVNPQSEAFLRECFIS